MLSMVSGSFGFLQATRALWEIIHLPQSPEILILYFPRLFVALLFQVFSSSEQMPVEVKTFWRQCQHKHCLPTNPNRCSILYLPFPSALGAGARIPGTTWALLCAQICIADHESTAQSP